MDICAGSITALFGNTIGAHYICTYPLLLAWHDDRRSPTSPRLHHLSCRLNDLYQIMHIKEECMTILSYILAIYSWHRPRFYQENESWLVRRMHESWLNCLLLVHFSTSDSLVGNWQPIIWPPRCNQGEGSGCQIARWAKSPLVLLGVHTYWPVVGSCTGRGGECVITCTACLSVKMVASCVEGIVYHDQIWTYLSAVLFQFAAHTLSLACLLRLSQLTTNTTKQCRYWDCGDRCCGIINQGNK